jgi:hypothetical protein
MRRSTSTGHSTDSASTETADSAALRAEKGLDTRYGIVLGLLAAAVVASIIAPPGRYWDVIAPALEGAAVIVVLGGGAAHRWVRNAVLLIVIASVAARFPSRGSLEEAFLNFLNMALVCAIPIVTGLRFRRHPVVDLQAVLGAVCIYLVIGIVFALLDAAVSDLLGVPFFAGQTNAGTSDYTYFSFITVATVGYGDLVPGASGARALAVAEALIGQLYLVTVVALLVSNFGAGRAQARVADAEANHLSSGARGPGESEQGRS